ncbi:MAG TPA: glycosyltransferase [Flavobacteriales bacterium]|nr:glycosyltransferase [Flavobacteriales bacterium]
MPPRIAIATPNRNVYSETFIAAHIGRLKDVVLVLSGGVLPQTANGRPLMLPLGTAGRLCNLWAHRVLGKDHRTMLRNRIAASLRRHRVQVLLAEYGPAGEALLDSAREAGVPLVVHFHGYDAHQHDIVEQNGRYQRLFDGAAALVVVSRAMEDQLLALGAPRNKLHRIVYGIDVAQFTPGDPATAPPHFLAVGRFTDKKAPWLTILAFGQVFGQRPDARLTMAGTGPLWNASADLVKALGLEACVDLCGVKAPEEIAAMMRQSRAFVQHSATPPSGDSEGTPLAVLEAMASGLPVVATRHAGIPDVVAHGERGLLCAEHDVEAMARYMVQLTDQPEQAAAMGRAGRAHVLANHRVEDRVGDLQALLDQMAIGSLA